MFSPSIQVPFEILRQKVCTKSKQVATETMQTSWVPFRWNYRVKVQHFQRVHRKQKRQRTRKESIYQLCVRHSYICRTRIKVSIQQSCKRAIGKKSEWGFCLLSKTRGKYTKEPRLIGASQDNPPVDGLLLRHPLIRVDRD